MNDLVKIETCKFDNILTKAGDINSLSFRTIDNKALQKIEDFMPEINRAVSVFCKSNSQTTASLMTLSMLESGPYRTLRQILAQIEKKRAALKENIYKIEKQKIDHAKNNYKLQKFAHEDEMIEKAELLLEQRKIEADIIDAQPHIEASIKELGAYQERYREVCKNHNIPENWDEKDFEDAEIEHHIKSMFRNAIRDRMAGTYNQGTMEYMEQFGIDPIVGHAFVDQFIHDVRYGLENGKQTNQIPAITTRYKFLDDMYDMFKNEYKHALKRIGIDKADYAEWLMKENK